MIDLNPDLWKAWGSGAMSVEHLSKEPKLVGIED